MQQKRPIIFYFLLIVLSATKPVQKGIIDFVAPGCCDPIRKKITFSDKFTEIPQILLTIRAIEYDVGPIGFFAQIQDVTLQDFHLQLSVLHSTLKQLSYEYVAINQEQVEFGFFNTDALSLMKQNESGDRVIPTFMRFKRTFTEDPVVQVFIVGLESTSKLVQFEVSPLTVNLQGVTLNLKKFGETNIQKIQLAYVATQSSKELAQLVTHTGAKKAEIESVQDEEVEEEQKEEEKKKEEEQEKKEEKKDEEASKEENKTFLQMRNEKPKLVQINGLNGLRYLQTPIGFMWQGDSIEPTALNVNLRITLDKGNQVVLGLYYFEEKPYKKCPRVYSQCHYQGNFISLCKDVANFNQIMKMAKSIEIPEKTSVIVYQENSYGGAKSKITKSMDCIQDWFSEIPEVEQQDIKTLLQVNSMRKYKNIEMLEIKQEEQRKIRKQNPQLQMPKWQESQIVEISDDYYDGFYGQKQTIVEKDSNHQMNSIRQELIQRFENDEQNYLRNRF